MTRRTKDERDALAAEVKRLRESDAGLSWGQIGRALGISGSWAAELGGRPCGRPSIQKIPCPQCATPMSYNADLCLQCARDRRSADQSAPILDAIANGLHSIPEIAGATGRRLDVTRRYLATLTRRGVVTRRQSLGYHKRWLYYLPE
jgi:hypothetical protein